MHIMLQTSVNTHRPSNQSALKRTNSKSLLRQRFQLRQTLCYDVALIVGRFFPAFQSALRPLSTSVGVYDSKIGSVQEGTVLHNWRAWRLMLDSSITIRGDCSMKGLIWRHHIFFAHSWPFTVSWYIRIRWPGMLHPSVAQENNMSFIAIETPDSTSVLLISHLTKISIKLTPLTLCSEGKTVDLPYQTSSSIVLVILRNCRMPLHNKHIWSFSISKVVDKEVKIQLLWLIHRIESILKIR